MVGFVATDFRPATAFGAWKQMIRVASVGVVFAVIVSWGSPAAQAMPEDGHGWAKDSTVATPESTTARPWIQQAANQTVEVVDQKGHQKASSGFQAAMPNQDQIANRPALRPAGRPLSPEEQIRRRQLGALKPTLRSNVISDPAIRPASNIVYTPREVPPVYPSPDELPAKTAAPSKTAAVAQQPAVQSEIVPYYQPHYSGSCNCPACRRQNDSHWISLEALVWWTSDVSVPPLITTSPNGTAPNLAGVPGANSDVLFGGGDIYDFSQPGFRARYGHWLDDDEVSALELEYFMLFEKGDNFYGRSGGDPILARPFTNVQTGAAPGGFPDAQIIAYPGLNAGSISVEADTWMYSIGLRYLHEIYLDYESDECGETYGQSSIDCSRKTRLYFGIGPRFYHLEDSIGIREEFTSTRSGNEYLLVDSFQTENSFLGGEIGLKARHRRGRWQADLGLNLGIGATRRELDIAGYSRVRNLNGGAEYPQGFLAQPTNIGSYDDTKFSLVPRLELDLKWEFAQGWSAMVGYNLMYWTNVWRAGEQIDGTVNADYLPPPVSAPGTSNRPQPQFHETDFLAHGISFGIERRY